ncbi:GLPGLI family protein [Sphingobacterium sp. HJSM2_6]|uniref:GLPGLI family protein n=1 Tax=Sphingobacterium sp. HJSM2_6 TaxID=3366264 RepID=UPI003BDFE35C
MKTSLVIIFMLFWISVHSQQSDFQFTNTFKYKLTYQEDSTNRNNIKELLFDLLINENESLFQASKSVKADSISFFHKREKANQIISIGMPITAVYKFNYKIVKRNSIITTYDEVIGYNMDGTVPLYYYNEDREAFENWELLSDTLRIGNFLCQKATIQYAGRKWIAYFTPEIPISEGPYTFCGLPGLILKIHDDKNYWNFDLLTSISHSPPKKVSINFQAKYIIKHVTKDQFFTEREQFQKNLLLILQSMGSEVSPTTRENYHKRLVADNNWIQLFQ